MRSCELRVDWGLIFAGWCVVRNTLSPRSLFLFFLLRITSDMVVSVAGAFVLVLGTGAAYGPFTYVFQHKPISFADRIPLPEQRVFFLLHVKHAELILRLFA
jgi:hypothetical protein